MAKNKYYYTEGNTARAYYESPVRKPREERHEEEERRISREQESSLDLRAQLPFALLVLLTTILFTALCCNYLNIRASIKTTRSSIVALENELAELKADNLAVENRLEASLDLDHVRHVAIEELGMIYPNENERITYEAQVREYVRQHDADSET